jgi:exosome complex component CSL4
MKKQTQRRESGQFIVPGGLLGVIEEFIPGKGTYVENGRIFAQISGRTLLDHQNRTVSVYPLVRIAKVPRVGNIVIGQVRRLLSKTAIVRIFNIGGEPLTGVFSGLLYISDVSTAYFNSINDACKPGDIIRAKVISVKNQITHLSTTDKDLGVLYTFCSRCGHMLDRKRYTMSCPRCRNVEKRRIAPDYGNIVLPKEGVAYEDKSTHKS